MRRAKGIIFAFAALGEARKPAGLPQCANSVSPAGQYLMRIALMTHIPDEPVFGRVEHIVDRGGQLDHTQPCAEMPAGYRNRADNLCTQFIGKLTQIAFFQFAKVGRNISPCRAAVFSGGLLVCCSCRAAITANIARVE